MIDQVNVLVIVEVIEQVVKVLVKVILGLAHPHPQSLKQPCVVLLMHCDHGLENEDGIENYVFLRTLEILEELERL